MKGKGGEDRREEGVNTVHVYTHVFVSKCRGYRSTAGMQTE